MKTTTQVMFRYENRKEFKGDIYALFPYEINDLSGNVISYSRIGQHSGADYNSCICSSRPATEAEFADLKKELESMGYVFEVVRKRNYSKYLESFIEARQ